MSAIALVPHTGWTWLVRVDGDGAAAVSRARVVVLPTLDAELYHLARDHDGDRARFFAARRTAARDGAIAAMRPHCAGVARAVVLGKRPALPALDAIVASHAMIHGGEGELWRALFAEACAAHGVTATRVLAMPAKPRDARWLAAIGAALGPPWTKEIKEAAIAARLAEGDARIDPRRSP